jgi:hypothetical protein
MKIEQLLAPFLIQNKTFSLQNIGTFHLVSEPIISKDEMQNFIFPEDSIQFTADKHAQQDDQLIIYITEKTKKIKPLATSDLESFTILSKQFLNIGKAAYIEGIGSLSKNNTGIYEFTQANKVVIHKETPSDFETKKAAELENKKTNKKSNGLTYLLITATIIIVACLVYFFLQKPSNNIPKDKLEKPMVIQKIDSITNNNDSVVKANVDSNLYLKNFKIIVRSYNSLREAEKGFKTLSKLSFGKNLVMYTKDSVQFFLAVPITGNINDTLKIKDSIIKKFGKTAFVDLY